MTWNYRVIRKEYPTAALPDERVYYEIHEIHEVFYGTELSLTVDAVAPYGATVAELRETLERMLRALDKPVIDYETRKEIKER